MRTDSKSTDKLDVISEIIYNIMADDTLKDKIKSIKIDWKSEICPGSGGDEDGECFAVVPTLDIQMN